ncbi:MAG: phosphoenolpyruvate carboxykinase (ATP), partial [Halobacteriovoraceae bacterium]|nr:phosphoenolpyruvate carboxykinase (ATP) [Halobacteriovoraceae bacterium]
MSTLNNLKLNPRHVPKKRPTIIDGEKIKKSGVKMDNIYKEMGLGEVKLHINISNEDLIKKTLERKEGILGNNGALVVKTGKYTGRAAKDKYVVKTPQNTDKFWWKNNLNAM